jgi:hypothetical protein
MNDLIPTSEAAKIADLSPSQIANLARKGQIEGRQFGRTWAVSRASVEAYAAKWHKPGPKRPKEEGKRQQWLKRQRPQSSQQTPGSRGCPRQRRQSSKPSNKKRSA